MALNWQIGELILNRWEIHKILKGGMGIVYIVYDHMLHEAFAAKTFQDEAFTRFPNIADRFVQEATTWINLDAHQNVAEARMVCYLWDKPYLFLEYVSGGDLSHWIGTPRLKQDLAQLLRFAIQFCDGMTHVLSKGVTVHRDVKPQNCLITPDHTLKVTDFGLAKVFDEIGQVEAEIPAPQGLSVVLTRTGTAAGTCTHMAPEQFDDAKNVDVRADIYSFGVMLFQMATGRLPFEGRTCQEFELLHKSQQVPALNLRSSGLTRIVQRCLAKDPVSRYGKFSEVRDGLAEIYRKLTGDELPQPIVGAALDAARWGNKGMNLGILGRLEESLVCFVRSLEINPRLETVWYGKGITLADLGRPEEALECFDRALEINPGFEGARDIKGLLLTNLGRSEEALECYDRGVEINPRSARAWSDKGDALISRKRPEEALACYECALEVNSRYAEAWMGKGIALAGLGRAEEALLCYDQALVVEPYYQQAWANKGTALAKLGRREEALACLDHALALDMGVAAIWFNKGNVLNEMGRREEAVGCYDRALEISPHFAGAWCNKGNAMADSGLSVEAIICYDRALEINPSIEVAWFAKGNVLLNDLRRYREALACFEEAYRLGFPQAAQGIAICRRMIGQQL